MNNKELLITLAIGFAIHIVGAVWYSPITFGPLRMKMIGINPTEMGSMVSVLLIVLALDIGMSFVIRYFIIHFKVLEIKQAVKMALLMWAGVTLPDIVPHYEFAGLPKGVLAIDGFHALAMLLMGCILHTIRNKKRR